MTPESALSFFIAIFIFGVTPGPGVFAIIARALVSGARSCTLLSLGSAAQAYHGEHLAPMRGDGSQPQAGEDQVDAIAYRHAQRQQRT